MQEDKAVSVLAELDIGGCKASKPESRVRPGQRTGSEAGAGEKVEEADSLGRGDEDGGTVIRCKTNHNGEVGVVAEDGCGRE